MTKQDRVFKRLHSRLQKDQKRRHLELGKLGFLLRTDMGLLNQLYQSIVDIIKQIGIDAHKEDFENMPGELELLCEEISELMGYYDSFQPFNVPGEKLQHQHEQHKIQRMNFRLQHDLLSGLKKQIEDYLNEYQAATNRHNIKNKAHRLRIYTERMMATLNQTILSRFHNLRQHLTESMQELSDLSKQ